MGKEPIPVSPEELEEILFRHFDAASSLNYAIKIVGHPGVGKSDIVRQAARKKNCYFIDTRLAFKENVDLGGYPVPDHEGERMVYYRPRFIPPREMPEGYEGMVWFLDESNRAHPTVIQTLFQIITDGICGEHELPAGTHVVLAGNLGEEDLTTITEFDDSALDGRLAVFRLVPSAGQWLSWAHKNEIHPSIIRYITLYPERLWEPSRINPNPRGWHQVSSTLRDVYGLESDRDLMIFLAGSGTEVLEKVVMSLLGETAGHEFISELVAPRQITTENILEGDESVLEKLKEGEIPAEDLLWSLSGAVHHLTSRSAAAMGNLSEGEKRELANVLRFVAVTRADTRISFFFLIMKQSGILTAIPGAVREYTDEDTGERILDLFESFLHE